MTVLTKNPTSTYPPLGNFLDPEEAYSSDDSYATGYKDGDVQQYGDYGFDSSLPPSVNITKVEVGLEFYVSESANSIQIRISVDGGSTWSAWSTEFKLESEDMLWVDVTAYKTWSRDDLLDGNWLIQIRYNTSGAGAGCPEKEAWTLYLDWIPTRVTYSSVAKALKRLLTGVGL